MFYPDLYTQVGKFVHVSCWPSSEMAQLLVVCLSPSSRAMCDAINWKPGAQRVNSPKLMERQGNVQEQALTCTPGMLPISAKEIMPTGCTLQKGGKHAPVLTKVWLSPNLGIQKVSSILGNTEKEAKFWLCWVYFHWANWRWDTRWWGKNRKLLTRGSNKYIF